MQPHVRWAFGVASLVLIAAVYEVLSSPVAVVFIAIHLWGVVGLWRGWPWGGFGPALFRVGSVVAAVWVILALGTNDQRLLVLALPFDIGAAWLLYRGGRALSQGSVHRGAAVFWVALTLAYVAGTALLSTSYRLFTIPTGGMEDTILLGDHVVMAPLTTPAPSRGEIVIYRYPVDEEQVFNKRVIGVPGDRIRIINKQLILNGTAAPEPYAVHKDGYMDSFRDNFPTVPNVGVEPRAVEMLANHTRNGEIVVPEGMLFVMGDNRDRSLDSRYTGFVPQTNVMGTAWLVLMSAEPDMPWFRGLRWKRLFLRLQ